MNGVGTGVDADHQRAGFRARSAFTPVPGPDINDEE
jgi:hypothetical protein